MLLLLKCGPVRKPGIPMALSYRCITNHNVRRKHQLAGAGLAAGPTTMRKL
jgi:hypothetical protein